MTLPQNLSPDYKFLAVIGHPIQQSLSPLMHNTAFQVLGLHYLYAAYDIEPASLPTALRDMKNSGFAGFNVTIPHKQAILPLLEDVDYEARHVGAVNTVSLQDNRLIGYNTDVYGVLKTLEPYHSEISNKDVLILGSGGATRAVVYALEKYFKPGKIVISCRSPQKAESLIADLKIQAAIVSFPPSESSTNYSLVVNATPIGMHPEVGVSPITDKEFFRKGQIVFDLISRPLETKFLKAARAAGATTLRGLEMLIHQGAKSFTIWTGNEMPIDHVRRVLEDKLREEK